MNASMGPRLKGVEDQVRALMQEAEAMASMGPRLKGVEDVVQIDGSERKTCASMGPRLKGVEDPSSGFRCMMTPPGFNGATPQGRGRLVPSFFRSKPCE